MLKNLRYNLSTEKTKKVLCFMLTFLFFVSLWHTAWISEESLLTVRTIYNFLSGYGPVFNVGERVQAYTHPLWFFLLSASTWYFDTFFEFYQGVFATIFLISFILSLLTFWLYLKLFTKNTINIFFGAFLLIFSRSFVDFSTSGLEGPLTHFLLLLFVYFSLNVEKSEKNVTVSFLLAALLYLNRPDNILLVAPVLVYLFKKYSSQQGKRALIHKGLFIFFGLTGLWTLFSLIYYGFPFPNSAYSKFFIDFSSIKLFKQGLNYILFCFLTDPITPTIIVIAFSIMLFSSPLACSFAIGIALYMLFLISIGGDFMVGRFLGGMYLISCIFLIQIKKNYLSYYARHPRLFNLQIFGYFFFIISFGFNGYYYNWIASNQIDQRFFGYEHIADERMFLVSASSLPNFYHRDGQFKRIKNSSIYSGYYTDVVTGCGFIGSIALDRPAAFAIDTCANASAFLARLPIDSTKAWRVGHFQRKIPEGYKASVLNGENHLTDSEIRKYYEDIQLITAGKLFTLKRLKTIVKYNLGLGIHISNDDYKGDPE